MEKTLKIWGYHIQITINQLKGGLCGKNNN